MTLLVCPPIDLVPYTGVVSLIAEHTLDAFKAELIK
jgi:hypothetical protein